MRIAQQAVQVLSLLTSSQALQTLIPRLLLQLHNISLFQTAQAPFHLAACTQGQF